MTAYRGMPVSEGVAAGELYLPDAPAGTGTASVTVTADEVRAAFAAVAAERQTLAGQLRAAGRDHEADIVAVGGLIAADPALSGPALAALSGRVPLATAAGAVTAAAQAQAAILESLPDPDLAQRAGDVRQVAAAVIARLGGAAAAVPPPGTAFILVRADVDPADLIRLADGGNLAGAVSVGGGASSHAAIIARGLGLPMLAGADPRVVTVPGGRPAVIDATRGELRIGPAAEAAGLASTGLASTGLASTGPGGAAIAGAAPAGAVTGSASAGRGLQGSTPPAGGARHAAFVDGRAYTADGELVTVLCNVASAAETRLGLANGAAGVGLLRTEIPFTRAAGWPSRADHLAALTPVLSLLAGRRAVVRLLDFAGDKVPPFPGAEGLPAFLNAPGALAAQLGAILAAGSGTELAVMIPMVRVPGEVQLVRAALANAAAAAGVPPPPLGMMVELAATARSAPAFAGSAGFFSIGTNDLTADVLGRDRSALGPADAAERRVLTAIGEVVRAARQAGIGLSVCGDAAADPAVLPLLLDLGVRTVSVGAAKVPAVARWIAEYTSPPGTSSHAGGSSAGGSPATSPPATSPSAGGSLAGRPSAADTAAGPGNGPERAAVPDAG
jgi:phosphoenolpyruvate-protein kinase (PTS system EI component)